MRVLGALLALGAVVAATRAPSAQAKKAAVRQQDSEYVDPELLSQVFTSTPPTPPGSQRDRDAPLSQEFICSVFGGPSCPENTPTTDSPCKCDSGADCQCVPYYQCDKSTGSFNQFGVGVIDIRQGNSSGPADCPHYLYKCCKPSISKSPPSDPYAPTPPPTQDTYGPPPTQDTYGPSPTQDTYGPPPTQDTYGPPPTQHTYVPLPGDGHPPTDGPHGGGSAEPSAHGPAGPASPPGAPGAPGPARCGARNPEGIGVRITGDQDGEAQFGEFPWMVAILKVEMDDDEKKRNLYQCGGALITAQIVLTAAHCVKTSNARQLKVRAGEWDTQTSKEMYRHQDVAVEDVVVHPDYYAGAVHNDVALLFLNDPVHLGYHIGTICMPEQNQNFDYNNCFVSGWGKDKFGQQGKYQVILKKLELPIVPNDECQDLLRRTRLGIHFVLHNSFLCAGGQEGKDTCKGDGGSPLVCPMPHDPSRYQLAGTVAWGIDCGLRGVPGVYGNVPLFREWVDEQLRLRHIDSTPYLP